MSAFDSAAFDVNSFDTDAFDIILVAPGIQPVRGRKPRVRKISMRSASFSIAGPEQSYPTYQFSNRTFSERPKHNPFKGL